MASKWGRIKMVLLLLDNHATTDVQTRVCNSAFRLRRTGIDSNLTVVNLDKNNDNLIVDFNFKTISGN